MFSVDTVGGGASPSLSSVFFMFSMSAYLILEYSTETEPDNVNLVGLNEVIKLFIYAVLDNSGSQNVARHQSA